MRFSVNRETGESVNWCVEVSRHLKGGAFGIVSGPAAWLAVRRGSRSALAVCALPVIGRPQDHTPASRRVCLDLSLRVDSLESPDVNIHNRRPTFWTTGVPAASSLGGSRFLR